MTWGSMRQDEREELRLSLHIDVTSSDRERPPSHTARTVRCSHLGWPGGSTMAIKENVSVSDPSGANTRYTTVETVTGGTICTTTRKPVVVNR